MQDAPYDATRQPVDMEWYYRRTGVLGAERNAQGVASLVLTLQKLSANLMSIFHNDVHRPSLDLTRKNGVALVLTVRACVLQVLTFESQCSVRSEL